jgi:hypothetical protein
VASPIKKKEKRIKSLLIQRIVRQDLTAYDQGKPYAFMISATLGVGWISTTAPGYTTAEFGFLALLILCVLGFFVYVFENETVAIH